jgi:SagB-type dehydrogenase family enzyme
MPSQTKTVLFILLILGTAIPSVGGMGDMEKQAHPNVIKLPEPAYKSTFSVEQALFERRSVRHYKDTPLTLTEVSQILWAAQGITSPAGRRTVPSAGALYPLEVYLVVGKVVDWTAGVYKYIPREHALRRHLEGDKRAQLSSAALSQPWVANAPAVLVISAVYERTTRKYRERGMRYVHMEAGHTAQNVYLQAASLGLATVAVGAFDDARIKNLLNLPNEEEPLYLLPLGRAGE